jgi:hypothetical protein
VHRSFERWIKPERIGVPQSRNIPAGRKNHRKIPIPGDQTFAVGYHHGRIRSPGLPDSRTGEAKNSDKPESKGKHKHGKLKAVVFLRHGSSFRSTPI